MEIWKSIKGYEDLYKISNYGEVKNIKTGKILKKGIRRGYYYISLYKNRKIKKYSIHRLVGEYFISNLYNKPQINHIDCNKLNNYFKNLEWVTPKENAIHAFKNNRYKTCGIANMRKMAFLYKLSHRIRVRQRDSNNNVIAIFPSIKIADFKTGIDRRIISKCVKGEYHTAGGFLWEKYC